MRIKERGTIIMNRELEQKLGNQKGTKKKKKPTKWIILGVVECIVLACIFGYGYFLRTWSLIQRPDFVLENVQNTDLDVDTVEKMKGYWTIALFGVDSRNSAVGAGTNADVNMICNINQDTGEIKLVSVYRDSYLNISTDGTYNKINQAYFKGGPEQAVQALNRNLDLNITDYVTFSWKAVADGINILGGIDMELSNAEFYYINSFITETVKATGIGSNHLKSAGMNHLDGVQAVAYGRLRLMDTDFARTERQRKVILAAFDKAKEADISDINTLVAAVFPQVATSIGVEDVVENVGNISKYYIGETTGFPQARGDVNMGSKGAVVVPQTLVSNVEHLHAFLFEDEEYEVSSTVRKISENIAYETGRYNEANFIESVPTDQGVIQKPKTTEASTEEDEEAETDEFGDLIEEEVETDENGDPIETEEVETDEFGDPIETEVETDENGDPIETEVETDENGDPIETEVETDEFGDPIETEAETDENGDPIETEVETDENGDPIEEETEAETDENGDPIETLPVLRPDDEVGPGGGTLPSQSVSPGGDISPGGSISPGTSNDSDENEGPGVVTTPGDTSSSGSITPGGSTSSGTSTTPGGSTSSGTSTAPGESTSSSTTPGGSSSSGTSTTPGGSISPGSTSPGTSTAPGSSSAPGSQTTSIPSSSGPGQ